MMEHPTSMVRDGDKVIFHQTTEDGKQIVTLTRKQIELARSLLEGEDMDDKTKYRDHNRGEEE